jgi:hypothetical protein
MENKIMSTEKRFTVAGTSTFNGQSKARFANDMAVRVKTLTKGGHTNIQLLELPKALTKAEAVEYLQNEGVLINPELDLAALGNKLAAIAVKSKTAENKSALKTGKPAKKQAKPAKEKAIKAVSTKSAEVAARAAV